MTFAWSGGIWFFATLAYKYGPFSLLLQIPWVLSVMLFGLLFGRILRAARLGTIHGFLASLYGERVRFVASIATTLGYIVNAGFELYWSGRLIAFSLGLPEMTLFVGVVLALVAGIYCCIGGYVANTTTDKPQNIAGVIALAFLVLFVAHGIPMVSTAYMMLAWLFMSGALLYTFTSIFVAPRITPRSFKIQGTLAVAAALSACILSVTLLITYGFASDSNHSALASVLPPIDLLLGIFTFQFFFNSVDMANWQQVAANADTEQEKIPYLTWAIIRSALYLMWFPALGGMLLGVGLKAATSSLSDDNLFQAAFTFVAPDVGEYVRGFVLGLLFFGLLSTTLSTADTYLMAAAHTIMYDLAFRADFLPYATRSITDGSQDTERTERTLVNRTRLLLVPLSLGMVFTFYILFSLLPDNVFDFQMLMYGFALTLFAPVMAGLFRPKMIHQGHKASAYWCILLGLVAAVGPYLIAMAFSLSPEQRSLIVNLSPVFSLVVSSCAFVLIGYFAKQQTIA